MPAEPCEEKVQRDLTDVYNNLMGGCQEDGSDSSHWCPAIDSRGNEHKLEHRKF